MVRNVISFLVLLALLSFLSGCAYSKKSTVELKGLMLLENTRLDRNRSYYSRHQANKIVKVHRKFHNKMKKAMWGKK